MHVFCIAAGKAKGARFRGPNVRPRVRPQIGTVEVGKQPSGLDISKKGDLALVTNRADNSITVLTISGKDVKVTDTIPMGDSVAHVAISADGTKALAIKPVANKVAFLKIDGQKVIYEKYDMPTGVFPYNVDIVPNGTIALVANNGAAGSADGNVDTVSVIDLDQNPPRVIDHVVVGDAPEGLAISPKGDLAPMVTSAYDDITMTEYEVPAFQKIPCPRKQLVQIGGDASHMSLYDNPNHLDLVGQACADFAKQYL